MPFLGHTLPLSVVERGTHRWHSIKDVLKRPRGDWINRWIGFLNGFLPRFVLPSERVTRATLSILLLYFVLSPYFFFSPHIFSSFLIIFLSRCARQISWDMRTRYPHRERREECN